MISAVIWTELIEPEARLRCISHTLAALVPFAIEGLVRDVVVVADRPDTGLVYLTDEAGAALVHPELALPEILSMKSYHFLVLKAGFTLESRVVERLMRHIHFTEDVSPLMIEETGRNWLRSFIFPERVGFLVSRTVLAQLSLLDPQKVLRQLGRVRVLRTQTTQPRW